MMSMTVPRAYSSTLSHATSIVAGRYAVTVDGVLMLFKRPAVISCYSSALGNIRGSCGGQLRVDLVDLDFLGDTSTLTAHSGWPNGLGWSRGFTGCR